ncbi:MAG: GDSL-type esterase/lipase family protein [Pseudomonadota bacterium]
MSVNAQPSDLQPIQLAVLGDSDSHSYGDTIWFPKHEGMRGSAFRDTTYQWTEILDRLRHHEVFQGEWDTWGRSGRLASLAQRLGLGIRMPRKRDYRFNFAWSGARCEDLGNGKVGQTSHLLRTIDASPSLWANGIVQIRIGINDLGTRQFSDRVAAEGLSERVKTKTDVCIDAVRQSVAALRSESPELKIVLVGILNNSDWPPFFDLWQSRREQNNINAMLDRFDDSLAELAAQDGAVAYFDDRDWFERHWGGRDRDGLPDYHSVDVAAGLSISNTQGDSYENAILADGHAGTMLNAIWVRDFIDFLNETWDLKLTPVTSVELESLAESLMK